MQNNTPTTLTVPVDADRSYWKAENLARQMSIKYSCEISVWRSGVTYHISACPIEGAFQGTSFVNGIRSYP